MVRTAVGSADDDEPDDDDDDAGGSDIQLPGFNVEFKLPVSTLSAFQVFAQSQSRMNEMLWATLRPSLDRIFETQFAGFRVALGAALEAQTQPWRDAIAELAKINFTPALSEQALRILSESGTAVIGVQEVLDQHDSLIDGPAPSNREVEEALTAEGLSPERLIVMAVVIAYLGLLIAGARAGVAMAGPSPERADRTLEALSEALTWLVFLIGALKADEG